MLEEKDLKNIIQENKQLKIMLNSYKLQALEFKRVLVNMVHKQKTCQQCNQEFQTPFSAKYCSVNCRRIAHNERDKIRDREERAKKRIIRSINCKKCDKKFTVNHNKLTIYCSDLCCQRDKFIPKQEKYNCLRCNTEYIKHNPAQTYCSKECKKNEERKREGRELLQKTCQNKECKKDFIATENSRQRYCSNKCKTKIKIFNALKKKRHNRIFIKCQSCDNTFPRNGIKKYCSVECKDTNKIFLNDLLGKIKNVRVSNPLTDKKPTCEKNKENITGNVGLVKKIDNSLQVENFKNSEHQQKKYSNISEQETSKFSENQTCNELRQDEVVSQLEKNQFNDGVKKEQTLINKAGLKIEKGAAKEKHNTDELKKEVNKSKKEMISFITDNVGHDLVFSGIPASSRMNKIKNLLYGINNKNLDKCCKEIEKRGGKMNYYAFSAFVSRCNEIDD